MQQADIWDVVAAILGYGLGSIPFGLLLTKLAGTADIRGIGSGNIGATNVLRTGRRDLAAATLILDALKGTLAVVVARRFAGEAGALMAAAAAFVGHIYPVWLGFRGGKGVATYLGSLFGIWWPAGLIFSGLWLAIAFTLRLSSAAALAASAAAPVVLAASGQVSASAVFLALALVLWWKHRANISRLLAGTESKIGQKS